MRYTCACIHIIFTVAKNSDFILTLFYKIWSIVSVKGYTSQIGCFIVGIYFGRHTGSCSKTACKSIGFTGVGNAFQYREFIFCGSIGCYNIGCKHKVIGFHTDWFKVVLFIFTCFIYIDDRTWSVFFTFIISKMIINYQNTVLKCWKSVICQDK